MEKRFNDESEVVKYLNENNADFTEVCNPITTKNGMVGWVFDITVECGDWKHSHGYLRTIMESAGYVQTQERHIYVAELEGSDCYSAIHRFVWGPAYALFNGKFE